MIGVTFDTQTTALATQCITWAENEIKKYLSRRYDISADAFQTSTSIPPMVTAWADQYSEGLMHTRMSRGGKESRERGREMMEMVIENLELVKDGELDVLNTSGTALVENSNSSMTVLSNTDDYPQTFDEDSPLDWSVSEDKLDLIKDERD